MFSELPTYPSQTFRFKAGDKIPQFVSREYDASSQHADARVRAVQSDPMQVSGAARHKFFKRPLLPPGPPPVQLAPQPASLAPPAPPPLPAGTMVTTATQSVYRESETQTLPYAPEYKLPQDPSDKQKHLTAKHFLPEGVPEVLTMQHLNYAEGLPPGLAEVETLEKQRLKRAFEASLPPLHDLANLPLRQRMMEEWESHEWHEREQEIKGLQDERLEVLQRAFAKREVALEEKASQRVENLKQGRLAEKQKVFAAIQQRRLNALRKLTKARKGVDPPKKDIIDKYAEFSSEVYAPTTRAGQFPDSQPRGLELDPKPFEPVNYQEVLELEASMPAKSMRATTKPPQQQRPANAQERHKAFVAKQLGHIEHVLAASKADANNERGHGDCWPAPLEEKEKVTGRRVHRGPERPETPALEHDLDAVARRAAVVLVQRLVRGRAVQNNMFQGKEKRLQLIRELQMEETAAHVPPPAPTSEQLEADKDIAPSMVEILKILTLTNVQEQARAMTQAMLNRKSQEQLDQEAAAIKIQAAVRGRQVRRVHANDKKSAEEKLSELTPDENYAHSSFAGGFSSEEQELAAIRIQKIQRGKMTRKRLNQQRADGDLLRARLRSQAEGEEGEVVAEAPAGEEEETEVQVGLPEERFHDMEYNDEQQAAIVKIQSAARGRAARQAVKKKRSDATKQAEPEYDEEQQAAIIKIQAGARGRKARKDVKQKRSDAAKQAEPEYDEEQQAAITKIQAGARGRKARKDVKQKREAMAAEKARKEALAELPDLDSYTDEHQQAIVKIQSSMRGRAARKKVNAMKVKEVEAVSVFRPLDDYTEDEQIAVIKIQSGARGRMARKEVQKKKVAAKPSPAETAANTIVLSAEDEKKLVAIQAGARGYLARKKVAEQKSSIKVNRFTGKPIDDDGKPLDEGPKIVQVGMRQDPPPAAVPSPSSPPVKSEGTEGPDAAEGDGAETSEDVPAASPDAQAADASVEAASGES